MLQLCNTTLVLLAPRHKINKPRLVHDESLLCSHISRGFSAYRDLCYNFPLSN